MNGNFKMEDSAFEGLTNDLVYDELFDLRNVFGLKFDKNVYEKYGFEFGNIPQPEKTTPTLSNHIVVWFVKLNQFIIYNYRVIQHIFFVKNV